MKNLHIPAILFILFFNHLSFSHYFPSEKIPALLNSVTFDDDKAHLLNAISGSHSAISATTLTKIIDEFSFDDGKVSAVFSLKDSIGNISFNEAGDILKEISFDDDRFRVLDLLKDKILAPQEPDQLRKIINMFAFDEGKVKAVKLLTNNVQTKDASCLFNAVINEITFDEEKIKALDIVMANIRKNASTSPANINVTLLPIVEKFNFSDAKTKALLALVASTRPDDLPTTEKLLDNIRLQGAPEEIQATVEHIHKAKKGEVSMQNSSPLNFIDLLNIAWAGGSPQINTHVNFRIKSAQ